MAVRIEFAPFMSRGEISPSQMQRGSWKLLLVFALESIGKQRDVQPALLRVSQAPRACAGPSLDQRALSHA